MISRWARPIWRHKANRGRRIRALARAVAWQGYKRLGGTVDLDIGRGIRLRCHRDSRAAGQMLYFRNRSDYDEMIFMERYLRLGDGFIDVGANVGVYTLLAAGSVGPDGRVDAFEPFPAPLARLRENVARNGLRQVHVHDAAAGREAGRVRFAPGHDDTVGRLASGAAQAITVDCVRLDDVITSPCTMGKMDIEGAEPLAFAGAERLLAQRNPPVWQIELAGAVLEFGYTQAQFRDWLGARGYRLALYDADARRLTVTDEPWRERDNCLAIADFPFVERRLQHAVEA
jgi:FkbM family methyltransferase